VGLALAFWTVRHVQRQERNLLLLKQSSGADALPNGTCVRVTVKENYRNARNMAD